MRTILSTVLVCFVVLLVASPVHAANQWFTVDVVETGLTKSGASSVRLTDRANSPAFTKKWFLLPDKVRKEMLATTLAAVTSKLPIRVRVDLEETGMPVIKIMYLKSE